MKGKEFDVRLTRLFLVLLAAGLLMWGAQGVALAQGYPADYNSPADTSGWIHTNSNGQSGMSPSKSATDQATMGDQMENGAEDSTVSAPPEDSPDSTAVSTMQPEGNDEQSSQGD